MRQRAFAIATLSLLAGAGCSSDVDAPAGTVPLCAGSAQGFLSAPFGETWFHSVTEITAQLGVTVAF